MAAMTCLWLFFFFHLPPFPFALSSQRVSLRSYSRNLQLVHFPRVYRCACSPPAVICTRAFNPRESAHAYVCAAVGRGGVR
uniref:Secreted protein n=1 Tax=Leishmania guyanensis TaxID=5670 RepID=A0A1E1IZ03_LEIGU|nr:Hypothetical protein BN36_2640460 [Leishmania guyanensis]CCM16566.1 Hypothetical protein BN36_2640700 [Leishmania guyanensis]